jgi:hypothetical protein
MMWKRKVIEKMLLDNIASVLKRVDKIETPQNKSLTEIFAIFKNEGDISI